MLDSVILIDHFNGIDAATEYLRKVIRRASISAITRAEVLTGFPSSSVAIAAKLLDRFRLLPIDGPVADIAAALRRENRLKLPDALQAAVALHHGLLLATRNTKDFPPRRYPFVRVPYRL
ncbi:MAG: type II toxin-antitoxin system VapC family toxin [Deltaproteobacteria bacterium]|nr:MAG: type II toxin-antitoxin system VapC family toxin [Deltaproteobacteria bacterium]